MGAGHPVSHGAQEPGLLSRCRLQGATSETNTTICDAQLPATAQECARLCRRSAATATAASWALPPASIGRIGGGALGGRRPPRRHHARDPLRGRGRRLWWRTAAISSRQGFPYLEEPPSSGRSCDHAPTRATPGELLIWSGEGTCARNCFGRAICAPAADGSV